MLKNEKNKIVILGAGLAGLGAAFRLENKYKFYHYELYEKEDRAGGLVKTEEINGFSFDCATHYLHLRNPEIKKTIFKLIGKNLKKHERRVFVYVFSKYIPYPFQASLYYLPDKIKKECLEELERINRNNPKTTVKKAKNFYDWVLANYGMAMGKYFLFPYNQKLWLRPPQKMTIDWTRHYFPKPELPEIIKGAKMPLKKNLGYNATFFYPKNGGIKQLPEAFAKFIKPIHFNKEVDSIDIIKREIKFKDRTKTNYESLITTLPLPVLLEKINKAPVVFKNFSQKLNFVSVLTVNLGIKEKVLKDKHWVYFSDPEIPFYRAGVYSNVEPSMAPPNSSCLYTETSYSPNNKIDEEVEIEKVIQILQKLKIIKDRNNVVAKKVIRLPYAYVIYDEFYQSVRRQILNFLEKNNIYSIGRFGGWDYFSMEDTIADGFKTADNILDK